MLAARVAPVVVMSTISSAWPDAGVEPLAAFAQQVLAGDADVDLARIQRLGDVGGREQADLGARQAGERGAVAARAARHLKAETGVGQPGLDLLLQAPLGGDGEDQRRAHSTPPTKARTGRTVQPTAVLGFPPSRAVSPS